MTDSDTGFPIEAGMWQWTVRVDPDDPSVLYVGTDNGVYKSTDGGETWRKSSAGLTSSAVSWVEPIPARRQYFMQAWLGASSGPTTAGRPGV